MHAPPPLHHPCFQRGRQFAQKASICEHSQSVRAGICFPTQPPAYVHGPHLKPPSFARETRPCAHGESHWPTDSQLSATCQYREAPRSPDWYPAPHHRPLNIAMNRRQSPYKAPDPSLPHYQWHAAVACAGFVTDQSPHNNSATAIRNTPPVPVQR